MEEHFYNTPIGTICIQNSETEILSLFLQDKPDEIGDKDKKKIHNNNLQTVGCEGIKRETSPLAKSAEKQLMEYLAGERKTFDLPLHIEGTVFQERVWRALLEIPYGETCTYAEIAKAVGNPKACRAVGSVNHKNPLMIFVPCHRVIGADGDLVGFGGGLAVKRYLLELERKYR